MKKSDFRVIVCVLLILSPFFLSNTVYERYNQLNATHGIAMSFMKFALLATFGEAIALRIKSGVFNQAGFGIFSRAVIWGFLGMTIKMAFVLFSSGTPTLLKYLGMNVMPIDSAHLTINSLVVAFSISTAMNLVYAPIMMTFHKITDIHITTNNGSISCLIKPLKFGEILQKIDWEKHLEFLFKKTIPFFWIPAHTITFLLPVDYQILFAAVLGVALGIILSISK